LPPAVIHKLEAKQPFEVDCDLKEFWAVINEKICGHSEYRQKVVTKSWTQYIFSQSEGPSLQLRQYNDQQ